MTTTRKHIGQTYRIRRLASDSTWAHRAGDLIGNNGKLIAIGTENAFTLQMKTGPLTGMTIFARCHLKLVPDRKLCYCKAHDFPHRPGGGKCLDEKADMFCDRCGEPCTASWKDTGIGFYEYWGQKCRDSRSEFLSDCCDGEVCSDASLTISYMPED